MDRTCRKRQPRRASSAAASGFVWVSTVLFLVLLPSTAVAIDPVLSWRHFATPVRFGVTSAVTHMKKKNGLMLTPEPAQASTRRAVQSTAAAAAPTIRVNTDDDERDDLFQEAQLAYSQPNNRSGPSRWLSRRAAPMNSESAYSTTSTDEFTEEDADTAVQQCSVSKQMVTSQESADSATTTARGGSAAAAFSYRPLLFWENMVAGAVSRSVAQTVMHPANTMKTILQSNTESTLINLLKPKNYSMLTRGAGANFLLSVPHGAVNFAVLEFIRSKMDNAVQTNSWLQKRAETIGPGLDFLSSAISTICCSIVSTPQMMITDNIMAGNYPNMPRAIRGLASERGIMGFYAGWWPGLAGKIPSYALTWTLFQELKAAHRRITQRDALDLENSIMGCLASATTVCIMIPMDTIKTRLVTQALQPGVVPYKGITDCAVRIFQEEGMGAFYRGLPPRLVSVVPMIGIQFGVYEFMKRVMVSRATTTAEGAAAVAGKKPPKHKKKESKEVEVEEYGRGQALEEAAMEVAADDEQPFPAPHFREKYGLKMKNGLKNGLKKEKAKAKQS